MAFIESLLFEFPKVTRWMQIRKGAALAAAVVGDVVERIQAALSYQAVPQQARARGPRAHASNNSLLILYHSLQLRTLKSLRYHLGVCIVVGKCCTAAESFELILQIVIVPW